MSDKFMFTRRRFLQTGLALASASSLVPAFVQRSAAASTDGADSRLSSQPGVPQDRILVVVELNGGNDGLNTVIPFGDPAYYHARPRIGIAEKDVIAWDTTQGIGLNPEMRDFKTMVDNKMAAVIQGVGYPNPNRSHFSSMDIWHTGDPLGGKGLGWIGKTLDHYRASHNGVIDPTACICIGNETPLATQGRQVKPIAFEDANLFRWAGADLHPVLEKEYQHISRVGAQGQLEVDPANQASFLMRTALDAQIASDKVRNAVSRKPVTNFPQSRLGRQLQMVAAMIRAEMPTRIYYVGMGGFDTHANQVYGHGRNLREFSNAMLSFYNELEAIGQKDRVLSLAFSEFGRRVQQNASNGTDHGTAAPVYLFGSAVKSGLLGTHPSLTNLDRGDLIYNVDFRSVYAAILENWMKIDSTKVLGRSFRIPNIIQTV
jgi:uncharacterized protein (DUF1501 family)